MIFSAKDAKLVWCPRALVVTPYDDVAVIANRDYSGKPDPRCCCVANRCACWVWATTDNGEWKDEGFCGLIKSDLTKN